ncbi:(2E,6E)-farnesyl diphosphate synthase [Candidatus Syntrophocurvum alkaliphilum]|uniref:Farnesyl diphosphate synthase n=1 Tax=Candidatus Syntrophocurvum alkaliphilum TaxID=2293317 RepID=A0A6I6D8Y4_9FIRM|nr:farnesyl diphosphate synthase [Candidatus Syntrophocurvum alkaliphilum]QGT98967.1 (2E,6E)-farnesyl diphosphate synthase [Candidatus Syntrophocurvum alkaliphilum]
MNLNIKDFEDQINTRRNYVNECLEQNLPPLNSYPPIIHEAMHYAVFNGGKRLRPIMVFEGALIAGIEKEKVIPTACALELIHSYSLVHDDLPSMDNDDFRRGKPTCHKVYGEANAILTGDALLTYAFQLIANNIAINGIQPLNVVRVIKEISSAAGSEGMIGGQVIDLDSEGKNINYDTLKTLHSLKTGELFRASLRAGAILGGLDNEKLDYLTTYANYFGLAFQITDDLLDVTGDQKTLGKPVGSDDKNNKTTYVSLFGIDKAKMLAEESVNTSIDNLKEFGKEADFLRNLAYFTLDRTK